MTLSPQSSSSTSRGSDVHGSTVLEGAARTGLVMYGLVHLVFAYVAVRLVFTDASGASTGTGALRQLAQGTAGRATLGVIAFGLAGLVVWQLSAAVVGYPHVRGWQAPVMRAGAVARAAVYGYLALASARLSLEGQSGTSGSPDSLSARLMSASGGELLLGMIGLVVAGVGIGLAVFGLAKKFLDQLDDHARRSDRRIPIVLVGQVGYVAKGAALVVVGALIVWAAVTNEPKKTGGLDSALLRLLGESYGKPAVLVVAVGIGLFGVYVLIRSRHDASDPVTS